MNDNRSKTITDWLMKQRFEDFGVLAFTTTPQERCIEAIKMFKEFMAKK